MGEPKQLLPWKNTFLLNHIINTAIQLDNSKTYVVLGANHEFIKSNIQRDDINIIHNENWELGLGSSIAFGITSIMKSEYKFDGVLIILGDQPLINLSYLKILCSKFTYGNNQIIASTYEGKKIGVPALFDMVYFDELSKLNEDKGAKKIINEHIAYVVGLDASTLIADIDTIEDYKKLYKANH